MASLKKFLLEKGYIKVPLNITKTNHFEITARINGIEGRFILDTGASSTCVDIDNVSLFNLAPEDSDVKAAGAGGSGMDTQIAKKNHLSIGEWQKSKVVIVLFNMTHVNTALTDHDSLPVNGIIGADILKKSKAIIDYDKKCVYLK
ncbi:acid protease [Flavobacteriaceae bacterium R38]|nr:acid protease [Flavobacteriaceae bacterium R38]